METVTHGESRTLPSACPDCKGNRQYGDPRGTAKAEDLRWRCSNPLCEKSRQWNVIEKGA